MGGEVIFDRSNKGGTIALGSNEIAHEDPRDGGGNCFNLVGVSLILQGRAWVRRLESTNQIGVGDMLVLFHRLGNFGHLEVSRVRMYLSR